MVWLYDSDGYRKTKVKDIEMANWIVKDCKLMFLVSQMTEQGRSRK